MTLRNLIKNIMMMIIMIELGMCVAAAKAVKTANPSPHATAEEEKESVKPEKPKEPDIRYRIYDGFSAWSCMSHMMITWSL